MTSGTTTLPHTLTIAQALAGAAVLGLDRLDAQLLLLHALGQPLDRRAWLLAHDGDALPEGAAAAFGALCSARLAGDPVAYLVGEKEFHGLALRVDPRVLVPRPDTETLVEWALALLPTAAPAKVLDLGTGSGAIALAIQRARPAAHVEAVDRSAEALAVARANGQRLGLPVHFRQGDWLDGTEGRYDLVVSNPPYIAAGDPHLPALAREPLQALVAGADGLDDIRRIVQDAPARLVAGGWLLLEHGHDQSAAVQQLLAGRGFVQVQSRNDLAGIARCAGGKWPAVK